MDDCTPIYVDGILYFSSTRRNRDTDESDLQYNENIYTSRYLDSVWSTPEKWYFFNSDDYTALSGMSHKGPRLFTYKTFGNGDLYASNYNTSLQKSNKGKWSRTKRLKSPINSDSHEQSISEANGTMVISSERLGGQGEHDLYWSIINVDGEYKNFYPIDIVNTPEDEVDVSLSKDGRTLYYSSSFSILGGYDILFTTLDENKHWTEPKELSINTPEDDRWFLDCDSMFFMTSSRDGGIGGDDLYWGHVVPKNKRDTTSIKKLEPLEAMLDTTLIVQIINFNERPNEQVFFNPNGTPDTLKQEKFLQIYDVLDSLEFEINVSRVQVGAYYYTTNVGEFKGHYQAFDTTNIVVETVKTSRGILYKYMIDEQYKTLEQSAVRQQSAIDQQSADINRYDYPKGKPYDAFIVAYDKSGQRIIIYFDVEHMDYRIILGDSKISY